MSTLIVKNLDAPTGESIVAPDLQLPSGSVVQVADITYSATSSVTTNSASYVDTGFTPLTITPQLAGSRIKVSFNGLVPHINPAATNHGVALRIYYKINSGSYQAINSGKEFGLYKSSGNWIDITGHGTAIHTPTYNVGDTISYQIFGRRSNNTGNTYIHHSGGIELETGEDMQVVFTAMEIAG